MDGASFSRSGQAQTETALGRSLGKAHLHSRPGFPARPPARGALAAVIISVLAAAIALGLASAGHAASQAGGIYVSAAELSVLPTSGAAWDRLYARAYGTWGDNGTITLMSGGHTDDTDVLAGALVYARTGDQTLRQRVRDAIGSIIGSEDASDTGCCGRALGFVRNTPGFVIAADLIGLASYDPALDSEFRAMLLDIRDWPTDGLASVQERRPNNFGTHASASRVAVDIYLADATDLDRAATVYRGWLGDRSSYAGFSYGELSWQSNPSQPVGINPVGATIQGNNVDGVLPDDQRRGGSFSWPAPNENYVWEALQGATLAAYLLDRAGYPAWQWQDKAILRAVTWLYQVNEFPPDGDDTWMPYLINRAYGTSFELGQANTGKSIGYTDWTHPAGNTSPTPPTPPSFRSSSSSIVSWNTQWAVNRPAGVEEGDLLLACVSTRKRAPASAPAGWTLVREDANPQGVGVAAAQRVYVKQAGASEPSSYTFTAPEPVSGATVVAAYTGVDPVSPVIAASGEYRFQPGSAYARAPGLTVGEQGVLLVGCYGHNGRRGAFPPTDASERADRWSSVYSTLWLGLELSDEELAGTASPGSPIVTGERAALDEALMNYAYTIGQLVALRPAT